MKILFEVLTRDGFEIVDPYIPAGAETLKILNDTKGYDVVRILKFDPTTLAISDISAELLFAYPGPFDDTAPLWARQQVGFDQLVAEERREAREWQQHVRSFSHAA